MVPCKKVDLDNSKKYYITQSGDFCVKSFQSTVRNIDKMLQGGNPITLIIPERVLNEKEIEEYRKFFCKYAKKVKRNMVYFKGPIIVKEYKVK